VGAFLLSKWYMDCASDSGEVIVAYAARLKWRAITLHYTSLLVHEPGQKPRVQTSMRASAEPVLDGEVITWTSESLAASGKWTALASAEPETIYTSPNGDVKWHCHQPRSRAEITIGDRVVRGLGYAEHLELTIEPWQMPIDSLRWGRFVGARSSLVWIDWRGGHDKKLVLYEGKPLASPEIEERAVSGEGVRLSIEEGATLRSGQIGKTALELVPGLEHFPVRILAVDEQKFTGRGTLEDANGRDEGFVIHEIVRWPERKAASENQALGKLLYALLFVALLPAALFFWARGTEAYVPLPAIHSVPIGAALSAIGALLVVAGWAALWRDGGGLPMNAFPPPRLVTRGVYALFAHPIYVGFCGICFGASILAGSSSGLWLVSPAIVLSAIALVLGYEKHDLDARFGQDRGAPLFGLPPADDSRPSIARAAAVALFAIGPYLALGSIRAVDLGAVLVALASPFLARTDRDLRALTIRATCGMALVLPMTLIVPSLEPARIASAAILAAPSWPLRAVALAGSIPDLVRAGPISAPATLFAVLFAGFIDYVWRALRAIAERVANSWYEIRLGRVRIINHGLWPALGTSGGIVIIGWLIGPGHTTAVLVCATASLLSAGVWAQTIEGSAALARPYGFYGGVLGTILAAFLAPLFGTPIWLLLAAYAVVAPYVQLMGRFRCLVQGCCHGSETIPEIGIRFTHPRSRVIRLAHMGGIPIHPTQLYSILWNIVSLVILLRLWEAHAALHIIGGVYLILGGTGRFAEEAFRGEPQTPIIARLRLYQWVALFQIIAGGVVSAVGRTQAAPTIVWNTAIVPAAALFGVFTFVMLGVDFPDSNKRFSRLA